MSHLMTKPTKWHVRPAKTQISLGGWSESSQCAQWVAKDPSFLHADSEDSDQTGRIPRLIWVFAGRSYHFVGFVMSRLLFSQHLKTITDSCILKLEHVYLIHCRALFANQTVFFKKYVPCANIFHCINLNVSPESGPVSTVTKSRFRSGGMLFSFTIASLLAIGSTVCSDWDIFLLKKTKNPNHKTASILSNPIQKLCSSGV